MISFKFIIDFDVQGEYFEFGYLYYYYFIHLNITNIVSFFMHN